MAPISPYMDLPVPKADSSTSPGTLPGPVRRHVPYAACPDAGLPQPAPSCPHQHSPAPTPGPALVAAIGPQTGAQRHAPTPGYLPPRTQTPPPPLGPAFFLRRSSSSDSSPSDPPPSWLRLLPLAHPLPIPPLLIPLPLLFRFSHWTKLLLVMN